VCFTLLLNAGKLTKRNIQNGYEVLNEIQAVLEGNHPNKESKLLDLTNKFFTIIPQDFGEERPKPIGTLWPWFGFTPMLTSQSRCHLNR